MRANERVAGQTRRPLTQADLYAGEVILQVEVSPEVLARLNAAASARGVTAEQFAAAALAQAAFSNSDVLRVVREVMAEDQEILDRLAET